MKMKILDRVEPRCQLVCSTGFKPVGDIIILCIEYIDDLGAEAHLFGEPVARIGVDGKGRIRA